jgi:hypothetical protein
MPYMVVAGHAIVLEWHCEMIDVPLRDLRSY